MKIKQALLITSLMIGLSGCNLAEKLSQVGDPPDMSQIQDPTLVSGYRPVTMPMPAPESPSHNGSSLWQTGSRAFFKDQRASRVGDILTVIAKIQHKSKLDGKVESQREVQEAGRLTNFMGYESKLKKIFPKAVDNTSLVDFDFYPQMKTKATTQYDNSLDFKMAASIIEVLPNGNLVIQGRQEVRDRVELFLIELKGIVRREDISSSNTIDYTKIAEARISRTTTGQVSDLNSTPWGVEALNKVFPF